MLSVVQFVKRVSCVYNRHIFLSCKCLFFKSIFVQNYFCFFKSILESWISLEFIYVAKMLNYCTLSRLNRKSWIYGLQFVASAIAYKSSILWWAENVKLAYSCKFHTTLYRVVAIFFFRCFVLRVLFSVWLL